MLFLISTQKHMFWPQHMVSIQRQINNEGLAFWQKRYIFNNWRHDPSTEVLWTPKILLYPKNADYLTP